MKSTIVIFFLSLSPLSLTAQGNGLNYNRDEVGCMTLLTERSNLVYINDTSVIHYHYNGFRREQLTLKGDSTVEVFKGKRIVPTTDTFELSIYHVAPDTLLYTEQFIAIDKGSLRSFENVNTRNFEYCDYIFSYHNEGILYRGKENKLYLRRNNYIDSLITFEIENGRFISDDPDNILVEPGNERISTITVYQDGKMILRNQFRVGN